MKHGHISDMVAKALAGDLLKGDEIGALFSVPIKTEESFYIQWAGRSISDRVSQGRAEVHAQVGLNISPCFNDCLFCSFARVNGVFSQQSETALEDIIARCAGFEQDGAHAIYLMCTADFDFDRLIDCTAAVRLALQPGTVLIANSADFNAKQARRLRDAGCIGVYHALRLGEGRDTRIAPERRLETFRAAREEGLLLGTCLEPVGPEHTISELVEKTLIARDAEPVYCGAARRIPISGTKLAAYGIVSEARMAHILAVVRLAMGFGVQGNCTHEPNAAGAIAGANLFWAESGANPRDDREQTEKSRGLNVEGCRRLFVEAEWDVPAGPSRFFS